MRDDLVDHAVRHGMKPGDLAAGTADPQTGYGYPGGIHLLPDLR